MGKMANFIATYQVVKKHFKKVAFQNAVTLVNGIFFVVCLLLLVFLEFHEALFLAIVLFLNIIIGIIQDLRAKVALERLQILMTPKITRLHKNGLEETVRLEDVTMGDVLKVSLGDQIPADGVIVESRGLEVNEALITGESNSVAKTVGSKTLAGSIATAGWGSLQVTVPPSESFVSQMTNKIKQYTINLSPIQQTLNTFITYMTYLLLAVVIYVIYHGLTVHELLVSIVKDIAALTGTLVPQGLILATTVFFAYGAVRLFRKQVLLQEINATEKLGRIKNLCIDKTGTLTENKPTLESIELYGGTTQDQALQLIDGYIQANNDASETTKAIQAGRKPTFQGSVSDSLPFSSTRKFGTATLLQPGGTFVTITVGAPDVLLTRLGLAAEQEWLNAVINHYATQAKRLVLLAMADQNMLEAPVQESVLHPVAVFVLSNPLRTGTTDIINFFQNRGVSIRVISGDNPKTVQAIAVQAGIKHADIIVTGPEIERWDSEEFQERIPAYHLFARIKPEQKERIVELFKTQGFTAMVGDGANDALAIKKSDLGIAMFDGAGATRQIAQVVLMNNSFAALPTGVNLAETIITNIELVASAFFYSVTVGLSLFLILAILGYTYPLSPRNTTIINYFIVWLPMVYWTVFPAHQESTEENRSFLRRVLPYSILNGVLTAFAATLAFALGPEALRFSGSHILVVLTVAALGFWFFVLTPIAHRIPVTKQQKKVIYLLAGIGAVFLIFVMFHPGLSEFFDLQRPTLLPLISALSISFLVGWLQFQLVKRFFARPKT